jgi:hypothetical protein
MQRTNPSRLFGSLQKQTPQYRKDKEIKGLSIMGMIEM